MAKYELLPFPIGQTAFTGLTSSQFAATDKGEIEGREYLVEDLDYSSNPFRPRTFYGNDGGNRFKRIRVVRNTSAVAILPRQACIMKGSQYGQEVDGLCNLTAQECYPADEFLPAAGVPVSDLFYVTVDGCAEMLTDLAGGANNVLTATTQGFATGLGSWLVALTAVTSGATTAGRVLQQDVTGATTALSKNLINRIGLCLSSMTTAQTNAAVLCYVKRW